jgi:hypothetical protein
MYRNLKNKGLFGFRIAGPIGLVLLAIFLGIWFDTRRMSSFCFSEALSESPDCPRGYRRMRLGHSKSSLANDPYFHGILKIYKSIAGKKYPDDSESFLFDNGTNESLGKALKELSSLDPLDFLHEEVAQEVTADLRKARLVLSLTRQHLKSGGSIPIDPVLFCKGLLNFIAHVDRQDAILIELMVGISLRSIFLEILNLLQQKVELDLNAKNQIRRALEDTAKLRSTLAATLKYEESQTLELLRVVKRKFPIAYLNLYLFKGDPVTQLKEIYRDPKATGEKIKAKKFDFNSLHPLVITAVPNFSQAHTKYEKYLQTEEQWILRLR